VKLVKGGNLIQSQALEFDRETQHVKLTAESLFRNRNLIVRSQSADFDLASETGIFHTTEFTLVDRSARGAADTIELAKDGTADVRDVYYTTCPPGSRAWFLQASDIELDREQGLGRAKHARLRFGDVPVLYLPWFQFPIDNRRRTGVLFPTIGDSKNTGFDARIPLYVNLAPNYDAQITPRFMSERGTQVATEGRWLLARNKGQAGYEYLDEDHKTGERRSYFNAEHEGLLADRVGLEAHYGEVSDTHYFEDLGNRLEASAITHLERSVQLTYAAPAAYSVAARVTDFQTVLDPALIDPNTEPYKRVPEVRVDALTRRAKFGTRLGFTGQYANFIGTTSVQPNGQRLDLNPYLRFASDHKAWYTASQLDFHHTRYIVGNVSGELARTVPQFSVEGGLRFERLTGGGQLQTLEPRAFYLYVPFRNQSALPQFDSGEPDFDFVDLFANNRYSGLDRISDANHLALAFTSRLIDPAEGTQKLSASLGEIYRFRPSEVTLKTCTIGPCTVDSGGTDFIGELDYGMPWNLHFTTSGQWSQDRNRMVRSGAALRWRDGRRRADVVYRYRESLAVPAPFTGESLDQYDLSGATPVWGPLSALARWRFSREDARTLEALAGIEYETCCWALRGAWRRYQFAFDTTNLVPEYTTGLYVQLELKGLAKLGAGFQALLPPLN
jgi:LPS-assembly protein